MRLTQGGKGADVEQKPVELEYAKPKEPLPTDFDDFVTGLFVGRLRSRVFYLKGAYYLCLVLLLCNRLQVWSNCTFGLSDPTPADYVTDVQQHCVPVVRAMKEFQRDYGRLPNDMKELIPHYLPDQSKESVQLHGAWAGKFEHYARWHHLIRYDFTPGNEHWEISGPFVQGRIPLPSVKVSAVTSPTTQKR